VWVAASEVAPGAHQPGPRQVDRARRVGLGSPDHDRLLAVARQHLQRLFDVRLGHDDGETDAHIEDGVHLLVGDPAALLDLLKDRWWLRQTVEYEAHLGRHARHVHEPVAGDVRHRVHTHVRIAHQRQRLTDVDSRRLEQLRHRRAPELRHDHPIVDAIRQQHLARQAQPVGVHAARRQADHDVALDHLAAVDHLVQRHGADAHPDQVETLARPHALDHLGDL